MYEFLLLFFIFLTLLLLISEIFFTFYQQINLLSSFLCLFTSLIMLEHVVGKKAASVCLKKVLNQVFQWKTRVCREIYFQTFA